MSTIRFTKDHEWISVEGDVGTVGITDYAQQQLGDVVYVEVPEAGQSLSQGDEAAVVESVKAASEIYAPVDGEVTEGNDAVADDPGAGQQRSDGCGLVLQDDDCQRRAARRVDGRGGVQELPGGA